MHSTGEVIPSLTSGNSNKSCLGLVKESLLSFYKYNLPDCVRISTVVVAVWYLKSGVVLSLSHSLHGFNVIKFVTYLMVSEAAMKYLVL